MCSRKQVIVSALYDPFFGRGRRWNPIDSNITSVGRSVFRER